MKCAKCGKGLPLHPQSVLCMNCFGEWLRLEKEIYRLFLKGEYLPVREKK